MEKSNPRGNNPSEEILTKEKINTRGKFISGEKNIQEKRFSPRGKNT